MTKRGNFEQYIDQKVNRAYANAGIAMIHKIPTPTIRRDGQLQYGAKSTVDFIGVMEGGKMVAFDCKETSKDILPMQMIHAHQVDYIKKVAAYGGIAFLLVRIGQPARYFRLELSYEWRISHWETRKSMSISDLERLASEVTEGWWNGEIS